MYTKSILFVSFVSLCMWFMNLNNMAYCQITAKIEFSGTKKQVRETKKMLGKYDIYFVLSGEEIKGNYINDSLLIIEKINQSQIEQIKNQEFVLVKFQDKKSCFYFMFSNEFIKSNVIRNLIIYRVPKKKRILGLFNITKKSKDLASEVSYSEKGMSISHPLRLIPCSEYKGEYDNGLEGYRNSQKKE